MNFLMDILETLILAVVLFVGINAVSARIRVDGASMEPTMHHNELVVVNRLGYRFGLPERRDVIVFHFPRDPEQEYIKRVIGLPGDAATCRAGSVNGVAIVEPYVKPGDTPGGGRPDFSIVVPAGKVWVMGDHRSDSADSRMHDDGTGALGSVPIDKINGRALMVVWPLSRLSWITAPQSVFGSVPAATP